MDLERKWVVAALLDLNGFRSWTYRASTSHEVKADFIISFYEVLQNYVRENVDCWSKYNGDGMLIVKEFSEIERKDPKKIAAFLLGLRQLMRQAFKVIHNAESSPHSIRIRIMDGYVFKIMVLDPCDQARKRLIPEYLEYCLNTLRGLLEVNSEIFALATESVVRKMGRSGSVFRPRPHRKPSCYPKGVNREDVDGLHELEL